MSGKQPAVFAHACARPPNSRLASLALAVAQVLLLQIPLGAHAPTYAQSGGGDGGEGNCGANPQPEARDPDDPDPEDPADDDPGSDEEEPGSDPGSDDLGDTGDGGAAQGDPAGTDGDGSDSYGRDYDPTPDPGEIPSNDSGGWTGGGAAGHWHDHLTVADPINLRLADKSHVQVDYLSKGVAPVRWARVYHSNLAANPAQVTMPLGYGWRSYYDRSVQIVSGTQVRLHRANGTTLDFTASGASWVSALPGGVLTQIAGGWQYVNHRDQIESYDSNGRLQSLSAGGVVTTLQYDVGARLVRVSNPFGRALSIGYDPAGRVLTVTLPDGNALNYGYDVQGNLVTVRFADNSSRRYVYENGAFPHALTGVIDESGKRRVTWGYDGQGRPNYGHYGSGTDAVSIVYGPGTATTTDVRGTQRVRTFGAVGMRTVLTGLQTLATADSPATSWSYAYDSAGNPTSVTSRTGEVQTYTADARARFTSATRASGTPIALTTQTIWHPTFRKPLQITVAGVTRTQTIDPYGRVTQVSLSSGSTISSTRSRTYNAQNLLQTVTDARGATTTFTYDASGNRTSATDALGQVTYYQNFNAHGQAGRIQRSNGTVVTRTFDARGRVASRSVNGRTTTFTYDLAGRVTLISRADGSWLSKSYDAAGYLVGLGNHRGETTLLGRDLTGRIVSKNAFSASGALTTSAIRRFDSRNRLAAVTDSRNFSIQYQYSADARLAATINPLGHVFSQQLDLLNRKTSLTQPNTTYMRQSGGAANVTTTLAYNTARAKLESVTDKRGVATGYGYDNLNRPAAESGADAGTSSAVRTGSGDVSSTTDARGVTLSITRDALGRVTAVTPPAGAAITVAYVPGRRDALPALMTDPSGSTAWTYDSEGKLLSKSQTIGGTTKTISVVRDPLGRVSKITYPSGMILTATYNGDTVASLAVNGASLLGNIKYLAQTKIAAGWTWGNGTIYGRSFDLDGRVVAVTLGSITRSYTYDAAGRVVSFVDTGASGSTTSTFSYDEAGQLTTYSGPQGSFSYGYDANGNRLQGQNLYTYAAGTNRLLTSPWTYQATYNADGKPSFDGYWFLNYDSFGQLVTANDLSNRRVYRAYNGQGMRVTSREAHWVQSGPLPLVKPQASSQTMKPTAATTAAAGYWATSSSRQYFYGDQGQLLGEYDSVSGYRQETIWFNGQPVGAMINGTLYYVAADNIGTPRSLRRASDNTEVWRWDSEPFGSTRNAGTVEYNLRFPGQVYDGHLLGSYHYNWRRDYSPWTGRYIQPDPLGLGDGGTRYAYVGGNPLTRIDPSGEIFFVPLLGWSSAALFGDAALIGGTWWWLTKRDPVPPPAPAGEGPRDKYNRCLDHCSKILERPKACPGIDYNTYDFHACMKQCLGE